MALNLHYGVLTILGGWDLLGVYLYVFHGVQTLCSILLVTITSVSSFIEVNNCCSGTYIHRTFFNAGLLGSGSVSLSLVPWVFHEALKFKLTLRFNIPVPCHYGTGGVV